MDSKQWEVMNLNIIVMCFIISYLIGSNNSGNSWSMTYSTRALKISTALFIGMIFEIIGCLAFRYRIDSTLQNLFEFTYSTASQKNRFYFETMSAEVIVRMTG